MGERLLDRQDQDLGKESDQADWKLLGERHDKAGNVTHRQI